MTLYVLSVGVSRYGHPKLTIPNADDDAAAIAAMMHQPTPPVFSAVDGLPPLLNEQATRANILTAMTDIAAKAQPDDLVIIFLAGHGAVVDGKYYFAPYDLGMHDPDLFRAATSAKNPASGKAFDQVYRKEGLSQDDMLPLIHSIKASRVAILLDTCYSASMATVDAVFRRDENHTMTEALGHAGGRFILSGAFAKALSDDTPADAANEDTASNENDGEDEDDGSGKRHGLFSSFVLRALAGEADIDHTGRVDIYKLTKYTMSHVEEESEKRRLPQSPWYFSMGQFFDLRATPTK